MIRFRTLGTADLTGVEGNAIVSVLAGPKRVALLAYLAVEGSNGLVRRDTLLPLFWPESDTERARASLRSALATLRRSLNDGVILVRGDDEVGVAEERLWCDAVEFRRLLAAGDLEQALELYRGEFLQGFFLSEAPEFEHWLERTRLALRNQAVEAAVALAQRHEGSGDAELAARWAARASELDPEDERLLRQRLEMLERTGNRAAALRVHDEFARRLWQKLEVEPSAQTQSLVHAMRLREAAGADHAPAPTVGAEPRRSPEITAVTVAQPEPPSPLTAPPAPPEAGPEPQPMRLQLPRAHRSPALALLLLALVVVLGASWAAWRWWNTRIDPAASTRIAVFPFSVRGADTLAYLGEGMVDLLSTKLDGVGEFQPVDPRAVLGLVSRDRAEYLDPAQAQPLAVQLGAGHYVLGNILEAGGRLHLTASLYDRRGRLETRAQVDVRNETHLFDLVDQLTTQLLAGRSSGPDARMTRLAASTTTSLPALKAYLEGERAFRRHRYDAANAAFKRALAVDSTFALAAYRLSTVAGWVDDFTNVDIAGDAARQAARFSDRLPPTDRMLVDGMLAFLSDAPDEAQRIYRTLVTQQPSNVEAWHRMGEVQYHDGPLLGHSPEQSRAAYQRVLSLDPEHQPARARLATLAARAGNRQALDTIIPRLLAAAPEDSLRWLHLRAYALDDAAAQTRFAALYPTLSDSLLWTLVEDVVAQTTNFQGAQRVARYLTKPSHSPELRIGGHLLLGWLEMVHGRPSAAKRQIAAVARLDPAAALEYRAVFAIPHVLPVPDTELRAIRDSVAAWQGTGVENPYLKLYTDMWPSIQQYLLALLSVRLRDDAGVQRHLSAMEPQESTPERLRVIARRKAAVRARVAALQGDPATAFALLEQRHFPGIPEERFPAINYFERHLRPGLLQALGRQQEALRWYGAAPWTGEAYLENTLWDLVHLAPFHLERAKILDRLGRGREAAQHYARFIDLWSKTDPELRPMVDEARRRLAQLPRAR